MANLDDSMSSFLVRIASFGLKLLATINNMGNVAVRLGDPQVFGTSAARVSAQMLAATMRRG
jgi:hypothetical protein